MRAALLNPLRDIRVDSRHVFIRVNPWLPLTERKVLPMYCLPATGTFTPNGFGHWTQDLGLVSLPPYGPSFSPENRKSNRRSDPLVFAWCTSMANRFVPPITSG